MIEYFANVKRDKENALLYCDKAIALDSTDVDFKHIREIIANANITPAKNATPKESKASNNKSAAIKSDANKPKTATQTTGE